MCIRDSLGTAAAASLLSFLMLRVVSLGCRPLADVETALAPLLALADAG